MKREKELLSEKLKPFHIIIFSCLLCSVLIINSNYVNQQRELKKLNAEKDQLFTRIISSRKLNEKEDKKAQTKEVCSRGSEDLIKYYQTGDLSLIDLDNEPIKCEDKDTSYMKALRGLAKSFLPNKKSNTNTDPNNVNLRNLDEGDSDSDNIIQYGLERVLAMVIFLGIGILSIFGWIACCFCNCYDCCCCCCCKKKTCKIPCFIFSYLFYGLAVAVCLYGLTQSNKIFTGLANTECSLLQFFDQILYGEEKEEQGARWAGIEGIVDMIKDLNSRITELKGEGTIGKLNDKINSIETPRNNFENKMKEAGKEIYNSQNPSSDYKSDISANFNNYNIKYKNTGGKTLNGNYVLETVAGLGLYNAESGEYSPAILSAWNQEYSGISSEADHYMETSKDSFQDILDTNIDPIKSALDDAEKSMDDIKKSFDDINKDLGDPLSDYSDDIDKYGKLAVKLVFSVLMVMNIALAVFITFIGLFSLKPCADCCFCRCLFKSAIHILWNILALMMILAFLVGSALALIGRVGEDLMSLVSFIFSAENFADANPLFVNELGEKGKNYINRCINGDGNIAEELNIDDSIGSLDSISSIESNISIVYNEFSNLINLCPTYNATKTNLNQIKNLEVVDFKLLSKNDYISFNDLLDTLNQEIKDSTSDPQEEWTKDKTSLLECQQGNNNDGTIESNAKFDVLKCNPINRDWIINKGTNNDIYKLANVIDESLKAVDKSIDNSKSFMKTLDELSVLYINYLNKYLDVLGFLKTTIGSIINIIRPYIEEGNAFSFLNGKFIGTNIKILLKYLKYSLGKDIYTVGLCLIIVGCSLILSISSTILLNIIINIDRNSIMNPNVPGAQSTAAPVTPGYIINNPNIGPQY